MVLALNQRYIFSIATGLIIGAAGSCTTKWLLTYYCTGGLIINIKIACCIAQFMCS